MRELSINAGVVNSGALNVALRAVLPGKVAGISTYELSQPISIWLEDAATASDSATALNTVAAHDPVFLSVDKSTIQADGTDPCTVTVRAPKANAAPVTLLVNGIDYPMSLTDGVATDTLVALDPTTVIITVKNPANRSTDTLTIQAV
jgi:hypothetical protein